MENKEIMELKTFLNVKSDSWNTHTFLSVLNKENKLQVSKSVEETNKYGIKHEFMVNTEIPFKNVVYYDYNRITDISLNLKKQNMVNFHIDFTESENFFVVLELLNRLKNADLTIEYHRYNTSQNDVDKGFQSELLRFIITTKSKTYKINIKNHCIDDCCLMYCNY